MRGFDSISEYPSVAKPEQTQWDGLRDRRSRPLDFPDEWEEQDLPHETSEQNANQQSSSQAKEKGDLIEMPLDADLLEYINSPNAASYKPLTSSTNMSKEEARKNQEDILRKAQELIDKLEQDIDKGKEDN